MYFLGGCPKKNGSAFFYQPGFNLDLESGLRLVMAGYPGWLEPPAGFSFCFGYGIFYHRCYFEPEPRKLNVLCLLRVGGRFFELLLLSYNEKRQ